MSAKARAKGARSQGGAAGRGARRARRRGEGEAGQGAGASELDEATRAELAGVDRSFEPTFADFGDVPDERAALAGLACADAGAAGPAGAGDEGGPAGAGEGDEGGPAGAAGDAGVPAAGERQGGAPVFELGRVIRLDRGYPLVCTRSGAYRSEHAIALVKGAQVRACVGDWVVLRLPDGHDKALIERVLPRRTTLSRWDGTRRGERQTLAANLDVVMVVQPLSERPISPDRIARSAVLAREGGCAVAAVLTKADRATEELVARDVAILRECVGDEVDVLVVCAAQGRGIEQVRTALPPQTTTLLLGESGAGKSTLVNALLGAEVLGTASVRDRDDQGRHTTVARRMLKVPGGGVIVDAPGLRSLPLLDEELGLARAFADIDALLGGCRFRDCTHGVEPGCAVRAACDAGEITRARLNEYRALVAEMRANRLSLDPSAKSSITV